MAEQDLGAVFQNLTLQIHGLTQRLNIQGVNQVISNFDGSPKLYNQWVKNIEKFAVLGNLSDNDKKLVAYQTSQGPVSDFVARWLNDNPAGTWAELKVQLSYRFADIVDTQHAFDLLNKIRQKPTENVQIFGERLLTMAAEAFSGQDINQPIIQSQLVNFFINGLSQDYLKMKILRENNQTLAQAVSTAMAEQNFRKKFDLRRGKGERQDFISDNFNHEPMEVDHYRAENKCSYCKRFGHKIKHCRDLRKREINEINAVSKDIRDKNQDYKTKNYPSRFSNNDRTNYTNSRSRGTFLCWNCGKPGHYRRNCYLPIRTNENQNAKIQEN